MTAGERAALERKAQGLGEHVTESAVLALVAGLMQETAGSKQTPHKPKAAG